MSASVSEMAATMSVAPLRAVRVAHVTTVDLTQRFLLLAQLRRLRDEGFDVTAISAPGPWVPDLEAEGIRHIPWPHATRSWDPRADARALAELIDIFRREQFDIVHTHNPKPGILGRLAGRLTRVPCVVNTVHGLYATPEDPLKKRAPVLALEWLAARFSDLELYQSEEDLAWARRVRLAPRARSVLLGNGCDLSRFHPDAVPAERRTALRHELGLSSEELVVGTVGRLVAEKGYREFFSAARRVRAAVPEVRFLAVGSPNLEKADSISEEETSAAQADVIFTGWREDVRDLLSIMDVFVLPSWREGVPRSAIEAAAMGRPLVLTSIRGCREVARDGVEAVLIPPRDEQRLVAEITRLLRDPGLRDRLGAAARARVEDRFDERNVADAVVDGYRQLLSRRGIPAAATRLTKAEAAGSIRIRPARPSDAPALARLHRQELPTAFLPSLGDRFLRRLYRALAADEHAVALVAEDAQEIAGFATGVPSVEAFYRRFCLRHGIPAVLAAAPRLLRPAVVRRLLETVRYPGEASSLPDAELLSIVVAPRHRARGVGGALAEEVLRGLSDCGAGEVKVVVAADNEGANRFYPRTGFRHWGQIAVHEGTPSNVWVRP